MAEIERLPQLPWDLLRLAELFDDQGDRSTAEMLVDCAYAAFVASAHLVGLARPPSEEGED